MTNKQRSEHVTYELEDHLSSTRRWIRQAIISLIAQAAQTDNLHKSDFQILDAGCGFGILMRDLEASGFEVTGLDADPVCVENAEEYGDVRVGDMDSVSAIFGRNSFDLIVSSHSLEHMENPKQVMEQFKSVSRGWILVAVPNPARLEVLLKHDLLRRNYSNEGHFYCWDRSHFENFLVNHCKLCINAWATDYVKIVPTRMLRSTFKRAGILEPIEVKFLPRILPYFATSLIALCRITSSNSRTIQT